MILIQTEFDDFTTREELLTLLSLETTRRIHSHNVKIINDIRSKAKQHRIFKVLLEQLSDFDKAVGKYSQVLKTLGQEFEDRFCDLDQLEPCVSFVKWT